MNSNNLNKLYDQLTARERLALLVAASAHADAVDRQRLQSSAPRLRLEAPHHYGLATALVEAADFHLLILLELAASYWQWWGLWGWHGQRRQSQSVPKQGSAGSAGGARTEDAKEFRLYCLVRYQAFLFLTHVEGWKQFCREWSIDPGVLLECLPGWDMVLRTEAQARERAFTPEDAAMFLLSETPLAKGSASEEFELPRVPTVEGLAQDWHTFLDRWSESVMEPGKG
jgi:hypothetical protein